MPSQTADHNIPYSEGTDAANTIDDTMEALAERVDELIVAHDAGSLASRPTSTPESPGIEGRVYRVNSGAAVGMVNYDTGTSWITLRDPDPGLVASRPAANTVPAGTQYRATDTGEMTISDGTGWYVVSDAVKEGLSDAGGVRRGVSIIDGSESRTNAAYGLLATPDRVSGIVLQEDGYIEIDFLAIWESSVADAGRAAIFIGENQLKIDRGTVNPVTQAAWLNTVSGSAGIPTVLGTAPQGLVSGGTADVITSDPVSTGQVVGASPVYSGNIEVDGTPVTVSDLFIGGSVKVFAAAGTYDVSVRFKSASGSVTVKQRKLWVRALGY